ncbi:MAG: alpha/beta hydrolase [Pseudomonadota bacterium]
MFFDGFEITEMEVPRGSIRLRAGGDGPPLLLLHGNPQTHAMWHAVAPELAGSHRVICPDLCGYGGSFKPAPSQDHAPHSKREIAGDMVALMEGLGFQSFALAGHDRGGRVAHRLALDHPERVSRLAILDIIPTLEHFERADMAFAMGYYHWFWFAQPHPFPENVINAAPDAWFRAHVSREPKDLDFFHREALEDYLAAVRNPAMIQGMCEDYRAAATIDLEHDRESRAAGEKIRCPLLVLWGTGARIEEWYDALAIWRSYASGPVQGEGIAAGHYLAEENPDAVLTAFRSFFGER